MTRCPQDRSTTSPPISRGSNGRQRNRVKREPKMWQTSPFGWNTFWPCCLAFTLTQMQRLRQTWVTTQWRSRGSPPMHLNKEQVWTASSRQSSSTHPWHQALEHSAVPVLMQSRWTWAIRDNITLCCTHTLWSCYIGEKQTKKLQNFWWQIGKDKCFKNHSVYCGLEKIW